MREVKIGNNEDGQRLDKFLQKYLKEATKSFLYKMLRKKNIKLNGKKAEGNEMLKQGDIVAIFFSDETLDKFIGKPTQQIYPVVPLSILYEDDHVVLINKKVGVLSQKAKQEDISLVEYFLGYLQSRGSWQPGGTFTPGICNRLDRNTSGIVIAGKSLLGLQKMSSLLKERSLEKYYLTIVEGVMTESAQISGYLSKDANENIVAIYDEDGPNRTRIETSYEPLAHNKRYTYLKVKLITGKTHQIRSHLSSIGYPLVGDLKYGGHPYPGLRSYFLHASEVKFPVLPKEFIKLSNKRMVAPLPLKFKQMKEKFFGKDVER